MSSKENVRKAGDHFYGQKTFDELNCLVQANDRLFDVKKEGALICKTRYPRDYFAEFDATDEAKYGDPSVNDRFCRVLECAQDMRHEETIGESETNMRLGKTPYN